jgi:hypothetical protein
MKEDNKTQDIQWHSPFRGAIKIELEPYKDILEYIDEKLITKKPLQIDLLIIKKPSGAKIENDIGRIFRAFNIMEYKSPTDYISIKNFYKVSAYAYLLKSDADSANEIPFEDLIISFVSSKAPKLVFEHLIHSRGYELIKQQDGIYYLNREMDIPVQFIALDELSTEHIWLGALTNRITEEKISKITADYDPAEKNEYKESILDTVVKANYAYIKGWREDNVMSKEVLELFRPEIEEAANKKILEYEAEAKKLRELEAKKLRELEAKKMKEVIMWLNQINMPISQIAQGTKMSEEQVQEIIRGME